MSADLTLRRLRGFPFKGDRVVMRMGSRPDLLGTIVRATSEGVVLIRIDTFQGSMYGYAEPDTVFPTLCKALRGVNDCGSAMWSTLHEEGWRLLPAPRQHNIPPRRHRS